MKTQLNRREDPNNFKTKISIRPEEQRQGLVAGYSTNADEKNILELPMSLEHSRLAYIWFRVKKIEK